MPIRSRGVRWRACTLVLFLAPALSGDQSSSSGPATLKNLTLEQLSQIEVSSPSKEPTPAFRSPVAIYVLTGDDIRRSGATTIPDALRLVPGVEVAQIDASKWSVGIRGFGTRLTRDVLVLIDGRTVYTELFAGTYWEVQDTLLEDIDRIEVIRGPGGTIWGPNAVDGVINIITKSSKDTQGAYTQAGGGSHEQGFLDSRYGGAAGGLTWRAYEKAFTRGPEYHPNGDSFDDWRGIQGGFRMDWGSARDAFTVEGDIYAQKDGEQASVTTYTPPLTIPAQDGFEDLSGGNVLFRWKRTFSNGNDFQLQVYYDRTNRMEPNLGEDRDTVDVDFLEESRWGDRHHLSYGLGARVAQGRFNEVASGLVFFPFRRTDYLMTAFVQDDIALVDRKLTLTAGSKMLSASYTHGILFQPTVRLMWTPTEKHALWTSFTHAVRTPSDAEANFYLSSDIGASNGIPVFARFNPNTRFVPEQLNAYELGFRQLAGRKVYVDVTAFYNHYHNLFSEDVTGGFSLQNSLPYPTALAPPSPYLLLPAQFQNDLYGATYGGEIAPEWRPTDFWRLRGSYSLLRMSLKAAPSATSIPLGSAQDEGSSPQHEVSLDSGFSLFRKLDLDLIYRFVSRLPYVSQNVPSYSTGDIRIAWRFARHLEFSIVARNLFQPYHVEYIGDPGGPVAIRRSGYASLAWVAR